MDATISELLLEWITLKPSIPHLSVNVVRLNITVQFRNNHFMHANIYRTEYWSKLSECLKKLEAGEYEKNRKDIYRILRPYMEAAIENAKKLDALNEGKQLLRRLREQRYING